MNVQVGSQLSLLRESSKAVGSILLYVSLCAYVKGSTESPGEETMQHYHRMGFTVKNEATVQRDCDNCTPPAACASPSFPMAPSALSSF